MSEETKGGRWYVVGEQGRLLKERLVKANSQAQAIREVVGERFYARAASVEDVVKMLTPEQTEKNPDLEGGGT